MRMRLIKVDGKNAAAYVLGKTLVIATRDTLMTKDGTLDDLIKLEPELKHGDLKSRGFQGAKR